MARVTGIGGFFFRAKDTTRLAAWYKEHFGVTDFWAQEAGMSAAGIAIETRPDEWDSPETGRFAHLYDPEGNKIELWEPPPAG